MGAAAQAPGVEGDLTLAERAGEADDARRRPSSVTARRPAEGKRRTITRTRRW